MKEKVKKMLKLLKFNFWEVQDYWWAVDLVGKKKKTVEALCSGLSELGLKNDCAGFCSKFKFICGYNNRNEFYCRLSIAFFENGKPLHNKKEKNNE